MKKQVLLFVIIISVFVLLIASTALTEKMLEIPKTSGPPIIDGEMDSIWYMVPEIDLIPTNYMGTNVDNWLDLFATFRVMYDDDNLYFLQSVYDDTLMLADPSLNPWESDGFQIFLDGDNSKGNRNDNMDDIELRFNYSIESTDEITYIAKWIPDLSLITFAQTITDFGWINEVAIPFLFESILEPYLGQEIGLEVQYNDNDTGVRNTNAKWNELNKDNSATRPFRHGTMILSERMVSSSALDVAYTEIPPVIDGELDTVWESIADISNNHYLAFNESFKDLFDQNDCRFFFRLLWDNSYLYTFVEIKDDALKVNNSDWWENDVLELQLDGNNSKGTNYEDPYDMQLAWKHGISSNNDIIIGASVNPPDLSNLSFAQKDTDDGWNLEIAFPMSVLGIDNPKDSQKIGFEVQYNDNDSNKRTIATKWWHDNDDHNPVDFGTIILTGSGISAVDEQDASLSPSTYNFAQNYPNPFNAETIIQYFIANPVRVKLTVFNIEGRHIATLVNESQSPGIYTVHFNASHLTSGIYLYKMHADERELYRKMILTR